MKERYLILEPRRSSLLMGAVLCLVVGLSLMLVIIFSGS